MEAEICKTETMNKTMSGKNYYVMLGCHTPMFSAVFELYWEAFEAWVNEYHCDFLDELDSLIFFKQQIWRGYTTRG